MQLPKSQRSWYKAHPSPALCRFVMSEKIQKVLARQGFASRREIERWIQAGRIIVNGQTAQLGDRISAHDQVTVDGR